MGPELPTTATNENPGTPGYQAMRRALDRIHVEAAAGGGG